MFDNLDEMICKKRMVVFLVIKTTRHVTKMLPSVTVLVVRTALLVLLGFFCCPSSLDVFLQVRMVTLMVIMMEWRMAKMVRMMMVIVSFFCTRSPN